MPKVLKVAFPEKCIRCELCVMEAQKQLNKVGLEGSLIRIFKNTETEEAQTISFTVHLDPLINKLDIESIKKICPTGVFTVEEQEENDGLLS